MRRGDDSEEIAAFERHYQIEPEEHDPVIEAIVGNDQSRRRRAPDRSKKRVRTYTETAWMPWKE